jgi:hypothetical protein
MLGYEKATDLPPNLRIAHGGDALPYIAEASIVCGFNSTTIFETLAAGKPVLLPWFSEALSPEALPYILDLRGIVPVAESAQVLKHRLIDLALNPLPVQGELDSAVSEALKYWTGNSDGNAGRRVREMIMNEQAIS